MGGIAASQGWGIGVPTSTVPSGPPGLYLSYLPDATEGVPYSTSLGYVYYLGKTIASTWTILSNGNLPVGASLSTSGSLNGILNATFPTAENISFTARVSYTYDGQSAYQDRVIKLTVFTTGSAAGGAGRSINLVMASLPAPAVGVPYSTSLGSASVSGTSPPIPIWSIADDGNLPGGYSLSTSGLLSATFPSATTYTFVVKLIATDSTPLERGISLTAVSSGGSTGNPTAPPTPPPEALPPPPAIFGTTQSEVADQWLVERFMTDDGLGYLNPTQNGTGTVDYETGVLYFPPELLFSTKTWSSAQSNGTGEWKTETNSDQFANGSQISVTYTPDGVTESSASQTLDAQPLVFRLLPYSSDLIVPGTVRFTIGSTVYEDFEGVISHTIDPDTGVGTPAGTMNYGTSEVILTDWVTGSSTFSIQSIATYRGQFIDTQYDFRTVSSPLKPNGFQIAATALDGELLTGEADVAGVITGDAMTGHVDVEYGRVQIQFGELVLDSSLTEDEKLEEWYDEADVDIDGYIWKPRKIIPQTGRYNTVVYSYLPLSANLLGLDPVRLPMDGRVPTCRAGDSAIIHFTDTLLLPNPVTASSTHDLEQTFLARVWIKDANQITIPGDKYTANLDTGILTFASDLNLTAYNQPLTAHFMMADEALVVDVDVSGTVTLGRSILHDFPLGSYLSTEIRIGDMGGRVTVPFAQTAWSSVWSDTLIGTATTAKFANNLYPIITTNDGAVQERWRIQFVSSTTVNVIGETLGQLNITALAITDVIAPINPVTSTPYFTIPIEGWGSGWISGNLLRFNTVSADFPIDVLRCVKMGPATGQPDRIGLEFLGDVDA